MQQTAKEQTVTATLKVLLVDDEAAIRGAISFGLKSFGFEVVAAADPREALAMLREDHAIGALLTDFRMPGMNGQELALGAQADRCEATALEVVIMSGHVSLVPAGSGTEPLVMLRKPFTIESLVEAMTESLRKATRRRAQGASDAG